MFQPTGCIWNQVCFWGRPIQPSGCICNQRGDFLAPWGSSISNLNIKSLFSSSRDLDVRSKISSKSEGSDPLRNNGLIAFELAATAKSEDNLLIEIEQFSASNHAEDIGWNSSILTDQREWITDSVTLLQSEVAFLQPNWPVSITWRANIKNYGTTKLPCRDYSRY